MTKFKYSIMMVSLLFFLLIAGCISSQRSTSNQKDSSSQRKTFYKTIPNSIYEADTKKLIMVKCFRAEKGKEGIDKSTLAVDIDQDKNIYFISNGHKFRFESSQLKEIRKHFKTVLDSEKGGSIGKTNKTVNEQLNDVSAFNFIISNTSFSSFAEPDKPSFYMWVHRVYDLQMEELKDYTEVLLLSKNNLKKIIFGISPSRIDMISKDFKTGIDDNKKLVINEIGMEFVKIPSGSFTMGSGNGSLNEIAHRVELTKDFGMQTTEVTIAQWKKFILATMYVSEAEKDGGAYFWKNYRFKKKEGSFWNNPQLKQSDNHPVTCVSWNDAQAFVRWLNTIDDYQYSLPSEAQWEYACRAGTNTNYFFGDNFNSTKISFSPDETKSTRSYGPNAWGLYDMHGNVSEWCLDKGKVKMFNINFQGIVTGTYQEGAKDPMADKGSYCIVRGGGWDPAVSSYKSSMSYKRFRYKPNERLNTVGFRVIIQHGI